MDKDQIVVEVFYLNHLDKYIEAQSVLFDLILVHMLLSSVIP
jgi:hypothetical protein